MSLWIESHQDLRDHPKVLRFAGRLKVSKAAALGHLHMLWWWALSYAQDGKLAGFDAAELAGAAEWDATRKGQDADFFVQTLKDCKWLDADGSIHDWHQYAGKLLDKREKDKERKRKEKGKAEEFQRNSDGKAQEKDGKPQAPYRTEPDSTGPYITKPDRRSEVPGSTGQQAAPGLTPEQENKDTANRWNITANAIRTAWGEQEARRMLDWAFKHQVLKHGEFAMLCVLLGSIEHTRIQGAKERIGDRVKYALAAVGGGRVNDDCAKEGRRMYERQEAVENPVQDWVAGLLKNAMGPSARSEPQKP